MVWRQNGGAPNGKYPASDGWGRRCRLMQRRMEDVKLTAGRGRNGLLLQAIELAATDLSDTFSQAEQQDDFAERWWKLAAHGYLPQVLAEVDRFIAYFTSQADTAEKAAAAERGKLFRSWAKKATAAGGGCSPRFLQGAKGLESHSCPWRQPPWSGGRNHFEPASRGRCGAKKVGACVVDGPG